MLKIHDWEHWQSYRSDRGQPPWIKIHRELMRNIKWVSLSDSERGQLISIWILAADNNGKIPDDEKVVMRLCYMTTKLNIKKFIQLGFIDANVTPTRRQHDAPETETETETETKEEKDIARAREVFKKPTVEEIKKYCVERNNLVDPESFFDFYESKNWMIGKNKMKSWEAAVRTWERKAGFKTGNSHIGNQNTEPTLKIKAQAVGMKTWEHTEQEICEAWEKQKASAN